MGHLSTSASSWQPLISPACVSDSALVLQDLNEAKDGQWTRYVFNKVTLHCVRLAVPQLSAACALLGLLQTSSCEAYTCLVKPHSF